MARRALDAVTGSELHKCDVNTLQDMGDSKGNRSVERNRVWFRITLRVPMQWMCTYITLVFKDGRMSWVTA